MEKIDISQLKGKLRSQIEKALQKHTKKEVKRALKDQLTNYKLRQLFSTKGGILGTDDWNKLQIAVDLLKGAINEL